MKRLAAIIILAVMTVMCIPAYAVQAQLTAVVTAEGRLAESGETYCIVLEAMGENCPMPEGSVDGKMCFNAAAGEEAVLFDMDFEEHDIYAYRVYQQKGPNSKCRYDDSVYEVKVYSYGSADKPYTIVVNDVDNGMKQDAITFVNIPVKESEDADIPQTGVVDRWMYYCAGAAVLLVVAGFMVFVLMRPDGECNE